MKTVNDKVERAIRFPALRGFVNEDSLKSVTPFSYNEAEETDSVGEIVQALGEDDVSRTAALRSAVNAHWKTTAKQKVETGPNEVVNALRDNVNNFVEQFGMSEEQALTFCLQQPLVRQGLVDTGVVFNESAPAVAAG